MVSYKKTCDNYRLIKEPSTINRVKVRTSRDVASFILENVYDNEEICYQECFGFIAFNNANITVGYKILFKGTMNCSLVDIKVLFKHLLDSLASAFIIFHNHPSGNPEPSENDKKLTNKIMDAAKTMDLSLLDSIIVCPEADGTIKYFSFKDKGLI